MERRSVAAIITFGSPSKPFLDYTNDRFLIALRKPGGQMGNRWEFPGGKSESGETDEESLIREIEEELHITPRVGSFIGSASFSNNAGKARVYGYLVMIHTMPQTYQEHSQLAWETFQRMLDMPLVDSDKLLIQDIMNRNPQGLSVSLAK